jgi:hypothetical protein
MPRPQCVKENAAVTRPEASEALALGMPSCKAQKKYIKCASAVPGTLPYLDRTVCCLISYISAFLQTNEISTGTKFHILAIGEK